MKRPSFQFYPGDWSKNPNLKRCTFAEKGIWLEVLGLMHDQLEYGVLRWPLKEIAEAVKCRPADLYTLQRKGVLKGDDIQLQAPYIYTPRSARKAGPPVTLLDLQAGPIWYSSRMVRDEYVRTVRGESTRFGEGNSAASNGPPNGAPKHSPNPPLSDGASSSSSSSTSVEEQENYRPPASSSKPTIPPCPYQAVIALYHEKLPDLPAVKAQSEPRLKRIQSMWKWVFTTTKSDGARRATTSAEALTWLSEYFVRTTSNDWLMGRTERTGKYKNWRCDLDFLCSDKGRIAVIERTEVEE